jgi:Flp pilus assembly protein TadG
MLRGQSSTRRGVTMVESAIVLTTMLALLIGFIVGALGIFRYQQVAACAREGARYASVHGAQYQRETGQAAATAADIYTNAILPMAVGLDADQLSYTVTWNTSDAPARVNPNSNPPGQPITNTVSVTVSYNWIPEAYFPAVTLTSTSVMPMSY